MRKSKSVFIGVFLSVLFIVSFAARYEAFTVGTLDVEQAATFASTVSIDGALTTTGGTVGDLTGSVSGAATLGLTEGWFDIINTTQLVFIATGVTNVIDADITTP